jgi:glutamate formiminotransferase
MESQKYVLLNGVKIPIEGSVSVQRITPFPQAFTTTAPTENDYTPTRKQRWSELQGGMGVEKWQPDKNDRFFDADGVDASLNVRTLGPLVTTMGTFGTQPVKIIKALGKIWAIGHNKISYWNTITSAWVSVKTDFGNPTDAISYYGVE